MNCELDAGYNKNDCAENGGIDELIVMNIENVEDYTLANGVITAMSMIDGKQAFRLVPDMESSSATQTPTRNRANNSSLFMQGLMFKAMDDDNETVDLMSKLLRGFFVFIAKKSHPEDQLYRVYGLVNGMTMTTTEDVIGQLYEELRGKTLNFEGKELAAAPSISAAIVNSLLTVAS